MYIFHALHLDHTPQSRKWRLVIENSILHVCIDAFNITFLRPIPYSRRCNTPSLSYYLVPLYRFSRVPSS